MSTPAHTGAGGSQGGASGSQGGGGGGGGGEDAPNPQQNNNQNNVLHNQLSSTIRIPQFTGNETVPQIQAFLRTCEQVQQSLNISDERFAFLVCLSLKDDAQTWLETMIGDDAAATKRWTTFRPLFEKRFCPQLSTNEFQMLLEAQSTQMKPTDKVLAYWDRQHVIARKLLQEAWPEARIAANQEDYLATLHLTLRTNFIKGLTEPIRKQLLTQQHTGITKNDMEALKMAAKTIQDGLVMPKKEEVAEVKLDTKLVEAVAVKLQNLRSNFQPRRNFNNNNRFRNQSSQRGGNGNSQNGYSANFSRGSNNNSRSQTSTQSKNNFRSSNTQRGGASGGQRKCFACGYSNHLVSNCPYIAKAKQLKGKKSNVASIEYNPDSDSAEVEEVFDEEQNFQ